MLRKGGKFHNKNDVILEMMSPETTKGSRNKYPGLQDNRFQSSEEGRCEVVAEKPSEDVQTR